MPSLNFLQAKSISHKNHSKILEGFLQGTFLYLRVFTLNFQPFFVCRCLEWNKKCESIFWPLLAKKVKSEKPIFGPRPILSCACKLERFDLSIWFSYELQLRPEHGYIQTQQSQLLKYLSDAFIRKLIILVKSYQFFTVVKF